MLGVGGIDVNGDDRRRGRGAKLVEAEDEYGVGGMSGSWAGVAVEAAARRPCSSSGGGGGGGGGGSSKQQQQHVTY